MGNVTQALNSCDHLFGYNDFDGSEFCDLEPITAKPHFSDQGQKPKIMEAGL